MNAAAASSHYGSEAVRVNYSDYSQGNPLSTNLHKRRAGTGILTFANKEMEKSMCE